YQPFKGKLNTLEAAYTAVLSGSPHPNANDTLFRSGTAAYNGNKGLDFNSDGRITSGEATSAVAANMFGGTRAVQQKLKNLGFDPKGVDGKFGPNTSKAVAAFQRSRNLPATGLMNERTGIALMSAKPTNSSGNDGNKV
ncbi:peptidoglycan-binding domain-containing protein, partial [Clavibacter michiganensis]|uniref:peptidoglycan-binding domain-containing protein n=1 Tax=Clavibacter michiganensis TaxID=28447 RepID=UPI00293077C6